MVKLISWYQELDHCCDSIRSYGSENFETGLQEELRKVVEIWDGKSIECSRQRWLDDCGKNAED